MSLLTTVQESQVGGYYFALNGANSGSTGPTGPTGSAGPSILSGKYLCVAGATQVIPITGLTSNGIVNLTYIHPNGGGAGQYFSTYVPTTNTLTLTLGQNASTPEFILWSVASL